MHPGFQFSIINFAGYTSTALKQGAYGLVFLACGGASPNEVSSNAFTFMRDELYIDEVTKKPIDKYQKPVDFLARMIELFTAPDDWVFDGFCKSGILLNLFRNLPMQA